MELVWLVPVTGIAAVLFALWLAWDVLRRATGTAAMQEIGGMIFEGAMAFLSRQYRTIAHLGRRHGGRHRRASSAPISEGVKDDRPRGRPGRLRRRGRRSATGRKAC